MKKSAGEDLKKAQVFTILDELRAKGERINADKVARIGKMGKQTVLPYYNEWRFLGDLAKGEEIELPEELVRNLKRDIVKWKYQLSESQRSAEETANKEIDELKQSLQQLLDKNAALEKSNEQLSEQLSQAASELATTLESKQQDHLKIAAIEEKLVAKDANIEQLKNLLAEQKQEHTDAMSTLEQQLDRRYQEQINHWMGVVDEERRSRHTLEKQIAADSDKIQTMNKSHLEVENRLEYKSRAHLKACEDKKALEDQISDLRDAAGISDKLTVILDCSSLDILPKVRDLLGNDKAHSGLQTKLDETQRTNATLQAQLTASKQQLHEFTRLELELERAKGVAEALEKALTAKHHE